MPVSETTEMWEHQVAAKDNETFRPQALDRWTLISPCLPRGYVFSGLVTITGTRIPDPPFSSFGPSRDYGMDLCLEVYL